MTIGKVILNVAVPSAQTEPAVNVNLAVESKALAEEYNAAQFAKQMTGTTADGGSVTVQRTGATTSTETGQQSYTYSAIVQGSDGQSLSLDFNENVRLNKGQDGSYSAYFSDSNKTRTYSADGSFAEVDGDLYAGSDADAIHFGVTGSAIKAGNGNNLVFVYDDNVSVTGGSGNDTVHLADNGRGVSVDTGDGNDSVTGKTVYDGNIQMGSGNNSVALSGLHGGSVTFADGDNSLDIGHIDAAQIALGDGSNSITSRLIINDASISAGNGNNTLAVDAFGENIMGNEYIVRSSTAGQISLGNGDNIISIQKSVSQSSLAVGGGNNTINVHTLVGEVNIGNGDNMLNVSSMGHELNRYSGASGRVTMGNGNNTVDVQQMVRMSDLGVGDGNNTINVGLMDFGRIDAGNGKNIISTGKMDKGSQIKVGNGNNTVKTKEMEMAAKVVLGNGNNTAYAGSMSSGSSMAFGDGNNSAYAGSISEVASMAFGDGNNSVIANTLKDSADIFFGNGDNALSIDHLKSGHVSFGAGMNSMFVGTMGIGYLNLGDNTLVLIESASIYGKHLQLEEGNEDKIIDLAKATNELERADMISQFEDTTGLSVEDIKNGLAKDMSSLFEVVFSEGSYASQNQTPQFMKGIEKYADAV